MEIESSSQSKKAEKKKKNQFTFLKRDKPITKSTESEEEAEYQEMERSYEAIEIGSERFTRYRGRVAQKLKKLTHKSFTEERGDLSIFEPSLDPEIVVTENSLELRRLVETTFKSNVNTYVLLMGNPGNGKSSALYYAIDESKFKGKDDLLLIEVDSLIYNSESKILNEIMDQIALLDQDVATSEKNYYAKLTDIFNKKNIVLFIKNAHVFGEKSRQTFLYSLFDHINNFSPRCLVALSTPNIFFKTLLEKRVKSRFNPVEFNFYDYSIEKLIEILLEKLVDKYYPFLSLFFIWALDSKEVRKHIFERYKNLGVSIGWFINLTKIALMYCNFKEMGEFIDQFDIITERRFLLKVENYARKLREKKIQHRDKAMENPLVNEAGAIKDMINVFKGKDKEYYIEHLEKALKDEGYFDKFENLKNDLSNYILKTYQKAARSVNFEFEESVLGMLPNPALVILKFLSHKKGSGVKVGILINELESFKLNLSFGRGTSKHNFSYKVLIETLEMLETMRIVYLSRVPVGMETNVVLLIPNMLVDEATKNL